MRKERLDLWLNNYDKLWKFAAQWNKIKFEKNNAFTKDKNPLGDL